MFLRIPTKKSMKNYSDEIMVNGKDYFVITTNVDHCFQKAGFDKKRYFTLKATTVCFNAICLDEDIYKVIKDVRK